MPRPSKRYTVPQPLEPLNLEEVKFWLRIMQEHAAFIKAGLPCDRTDLIDEAQAFYQEFGALLVRGDKVQSEKKFRELVNDSYNAVRDFYHYKRQLLQARITCKLGGSAYPLQLDHVAREAEYAMRLLAKLKDGKAILRTGTKTQENTFWLRIMGDHAKLISHLLDPSEWALISTANDFSRDFDHLFLQGRDFVSMLDHYSGDVPSYKRFTQDVRVSTRQLYDFKKALEDMLAECRLLSLMNPLFADHVRREADHYLLLQAMMDKDVMKNCFADEDDLDDLDDLETEDPDDVDCGEERQNTELTAEEIPVMIGGEAGAADKALFLQAEDQDEAEEALALEETPIPLPSAPKHEPFDPEAAVSPVTIDDDKIDEVEESQPAIIPPPAEIKAEAAKPAKQSKYKWGGKWPRALGKVPK